MKVENLQTKDFSTVDSLLPAELDPQVVAHIHEWRSMDHLPTIAIRAPEYRFIIHNFASDSGGAGMVSEGSGKPEYVPSPTQSTVTAEKLACIQAYLTKPWLTGLNG